MAYIEAHRTGAKHRQIRENMIFIGFNYPHQVVPGRLEKLHVQKTIPAVKREETGAVAST